MIFFHSIGNRNSYFVQILLKDFFSIKNVSDCLRTCSSSFFATYTKQNNLQQGLLLPVAFVTQAMFSHAEPGTFLKHKNSLNFFFFKKSKILLPKGVLNSSPNFIAKEMKLLKDHCSVIQEIESSCLEL